MKLTQYIDKYKETGQVFGGDYPNDLGTTSFVDGSPDAGFIGLQGNFSVAELRKLAYFADTHEQPDEEPCPYCKGTGKVEPKGGPMWEDQCEDCRGTGLRSQLLRPSEPDTLPSSAS